MFSDLGCSSRIKKMAFSDLNMKKFSENIWSLIYEDPRGSRTVLWSPENFEDRAISVLGSSKTKISKNNIWPIFCWSRPGIGQGGDLGEQTADWKNDLGEHFCNVEEHQACTPRTRSRSTLWMFCPFFSMNSGDSKIRNTPKLKFMRRESDTTIG